MFRNLSGYDAHLFIKELGKKSNKGNTEVIGENKETCICFNVKIIVMLAGLCNKDNKEARKNIQMRFKTVVDLWYQT